MNCLMGEMNPEFLLPLESLQKEIAVGNISFRELVEGFINLQVSKGDPNQCWIDHISSVPSLPIHSGPLLPLEGLLVGVKDNISTKDFPTMMGTSFWGGAKGGFDSRVVDTLRRRGAFVVGKTRCSEFAVHKRTTTLNPRYLDCEPGTSSSGSAAAVASGEVPITLGTQTAGSIIKPSSYCGIIGFKPSFGDIPRTGVLKTTELFDTVGFLGRRLVDIEAVYLATRVQGDNYPIHTRERSRLAQTPYSSIEVLTGDYIDTPSPFLAREFHRFAEKLAESMNLPLKKTKLQGDLGKIRQSFDQIYAKDLAYFLADHKIEKMVSEELWNMMDFGNSIDYADYVKAKELIQEWRLTYRSLSETPLYLSLATSSSAPIIGKPDLIDANLLITSLGFPQVSLPVIRDQNRKIVGVSLSSRRFTDDRLLAVAKEVFPGDALDVPSISV